MIAAAGAPFASATVLGAGPDLARAGQLFLSGCERRGDAGVSATALRVVLFGDDPGRAKELKLLVAAMSKGLSALWVEPVPRRHVRASSTRPPMPSACLSGNDGRPRPAVAQLRAPRAAAHRRPRPSLR